MNEGKLIYRDKSSIPYLYGMIVGVVVFCGLVLFAHTRELTFSDICAVLFFATVFLGISFLCLKQTKEKPGFYEYGIGYFQNDKMVRFESYENFLSIECYFKRNHSSFRATPEYGLIFYHVDGSSVKLTQSSIKPLKEIWQNILATNPTLGERLICQTTHAASKIIFNVFKTEDY